MMKLSACISLTWLMGGCLFLSGCDGSKVIWHAEAKSPDSRMIATAKTIENSGFGTGYIGTVVYLNFTTGSQQPTEILTFSDGPNIPHGMEVGMHWVTPKHLELTYAGARTIDFQAALYHGVEVTVRDLAASSK